MFGDHEPLSRRGFLGVGVCLATGSLARSAVPGAAESELTVPAGRARSRVVRARSRYAVKGPTVHPAMFEELLEETLTTLTETKNLGDAWRALLRPDDVVGLKFNRSAQAVLATTRSVAPILIDTIVRAGFKPQQIVCIEAPLDLKTPHKTAAPRMGYEREETAFGSGSDQLASVLKQVTAIVDVPYLKTHNIAGLTGALKNLSHGLVKHPARYHDHGCSPFIADIVALPEIRDKLRLCLVDALRVVYDKGPDATATTISDEGLLLASLDPVAVDAVGLSILNEIRDRAGLGPVAESASRLPYLADAHRKGLGIAVPHGIDVISRKLS
ncbi:MAG: DUF362 domain-containing protein [Planctomycetes bacterium]|nr:DUF362 domain-containing protein [Planctomycetota bacterium]